MFQSHQWVTSSWISEGQATGTEQNFSLSTAYLLKNQMESSGVDRNDANSLMGRIMQLCSFRRIKFYICLITPFALAPLALSRYKEARCGYVILWMAIYWMLEPVDITVTALLPVPLMPLLGILDAQEVAPNYMKEVLMMFIGGLGVAIAVEHCNLHERIALKVLLTLGADTKWLLFGFMATTMFLSMWISNTATTAMMVPIIEAVMAELSRKTHEDEMIADQTKLKTLHKTLLLSVAYSANCGGTGSITGTSPNMVFKGYMEELYPDSTEITYASWMAYNVPSMILCVLLAWLILQVLYVPCWHKEDSKTKERIQAVIDTRYKELGRMTFHESAVLTLFIVLVFLWIFREPKFMRGWIDLMPSDKRIGDAVPAIAILVLMFMIPAEPRRIVDSPPLLRWKVVQEKLPWGLVLLLGGGYALADGAQKSGLSKWLGHLLSKLFVLPPAAVLLLMCLITTTLTEVMSNSTVTTIIVPIVSQMAEASKINPLYFMLPVTVVASYAFMLPVATGPNAIIFGTGILETVDMIKPGIILNIIASAIQMFMVYTLGDHMFNLTTFPSWANSTNETLGR